MKYSCLATHGCLELIQGRGNSESVLFPDHRTLGGGGEEQPEVNIDRIGTGFM